MSSGGCVRTYTHTVASGMPVRVPQSLSDRILPEYCTAVFCCCWRSQVEEKSENAVSNGCDSNKQKGGELRVLPGFAPSRPSQQCGVRQLAGGGGGSGPQCDAAVRGRAGRRVSPRASGPSGRRADATRRDASISAERNRRWGSVPGCGVARGVMRTGRVTRCVPDGASHRGPLHRKCEAFSFECCSVL